MARLGPDRISHDRFGLDVLPGKVHDTQSPSITPDPPCRFRLMISFSEWDAKLCITGRIMAAKMEEAAKYLVDNLYIKSVVTT